MASDSEATERGLRWSTPLTQYLEFGPQTLATERICDALALATPRIPPARAGCAQSGVFRNGAFLLLSHFRFVAFCYSRVYWREKINLGAGVGLGEAPRIYLHCRTRLDTRHRYASAMYRLLHRND